MIAMVASWTSTKAKIQSWVYQHGKALCAEMLHGKALVDTVCCKGCKHKITICKHFSMPSQCKSKLHISGNVHTWNLKRFWPSWPYSCWPFLLLSKGLSKMFLAQLWHCSWELELGSHSLSWPCGPPCCHLGFSPNEKMAPKYLFSFPSPPLVEWSGTWNHLGNESKSCWLSLLSHGLVGPWGKSSACPWQRSCWQRHQKTFLQLPLNLLATGSSVESN